MKIVLIVEGKTEKAFISHLRVYLKKHLAGAMPNLDTHPYDGRIPTGDKLKRVVENHLKGKNPANRVIALTDVYTGTSPPDFRNAADAKAQMRAWVGDIPQFHPHAAQYDFEAWLLPYWPTIQRLAGHNKAAPAEYPEKVNHDNPPAHRIKEIFELGRCRDSYVKPRDAGRILRENDLSIAVNQCQELKALVNTIIGACTGSVIP
jgi:integrase